VNLRTLVANLRTFAAVVPGAMAALVRANEQQAAEIERLRAALAKTEPELARLREIERCAHNLAQGIRFAESMAVELRAALGAK
jgi:hypothetical protein